MKPYGMVLEPIGSHETDPFAESFDEYTDDLHNQHEEIKDEKRYPTCPSCAGVNITLQGRCVVCTDCGWSSCEL